MQPTCFVPMTIWVGLHAIMPAQLAIPNWSHLPTHQWATLTWIAAQSGPCWRSCLLNSWTSASSQGFAPALEHFPCRQVSAVCVRTDNVGTACKGPVPYAAHMLLVQSSA